MNQTRRAVLLIGSPKRNNSTSSALGDYLCAQMQERGFETQSIHINTAMGSEESTKQMLADVDSANVVILSFPLYVDSLPAETTRCLETIAKHRANDNRTGTPRLLAIANSGFPEASQNNTALDICRIFARQAGFQWLGGLAMGGGGAMHGLPVEDAGGMARHAKKALDMAAADIALDRPISEGAINEITKPVVPSWLYRWIANRQWRKQAKEAQITGRLDDRPYEE